MNKHSSLLICFAFPLIQKKMQKLNLVTTKHKKKSYFCISPGFNNFHVAVMERSWNRSLLQQYWSYGKGWCNQDTLISKLIISHIRTNGLLPSLDLSW